MWCGVVWCGVVWCDVMWCDAMRYDTIRYDMMFRWIINNTHQGDKRECILFSILVEAVTVTGSQEKSCITEFISSNGFKLFPHLTSMLKNCARSYNKTSACLGIRGSLSLRYFHYVYWRFHNHVIAYLNRNIPGKLGQYHGCWCPSLLSRQVISSK